MLRHLHRYQIKQHSEEWYNIRQRLITATKVSGYLESSRYGPKVSSYGYGNKQKNNVTTNPALIFGTRHEEPAQRALEKRWGSKIYDLGLGIHEKHSWLGASPDGIMLLADGSVNLVEIKCPYYRKITGKIPFDYWVQMQIQMEVWDVNGCVYSENEFSKPDEDFNNESQLGTLQKYWDVRVPRDRHWFGRIFPILCQNKQRLTRDKCLFWTQARDPYCVRNWVMGDPLLDWLGRWSEKWSEATKDKPKKYDLSRLASKQTKSFHSTILAKMTELGRNYVDISEEWFQRFAPSDDEWKTYISQPPIYKSFGKHRITMQAIQAGAPVIADGLLLDEPNKRWGKADLLVREDVLPYLFQNQKDVDNEDIDEELNQNKAGMRYYVVLTRFSSLNLCADGTHLLNNAKQKLYKAYIRFLTDCLPVDVQLPRGYVIGRKASWTSRNVKYRSDGYCTSWGCVDFRDKDSNYSTIVNDCLEWLERVDKEGSDWSPLQQQKKRKRITELCPNMKNQNDYPWHECKKRLAEQTDEITQILNIGPDKRNKMLESGIQGWKDLSLDHLSTFKVANKKAVNNILTANRENRLIGLADVAQNLPPQADLEFYFDFETVNDLNEHIGKELFDSSPGIGGQSNIIYMIGCYVRDSRTGQHEYLNYLVDEITPENERSILKDWFRDLKEIMAKCNDGANSANSDDSAIDSTDSDIDSNDARGLRKRRRRRLRRRDRVEASRTKKAAKMCMRMFHWSQAEIIQLKRVRKAYGDLVEIGEFMENTDFIDLYELFKKSEVGIPGAFNYGLKSVAKSLHSLGKINSTWEENMNGADAMVAAWHLKDRTDHEPHTHHNAKYGNGTLIDPEALVSTRNENKADALSKEIIIYNYYDCKVMDEITEFIRSV